MKIGFVGLGKLGLPCAVAIESKGHQVIGYDKNPNIKDYIKKGEIPYREKGMEILKKSKIKVESLETVVEQSDIVFVAVQTPHDPLYEGQYPMPKTTKDFNYSYLKKAVKDISHIISEMNRDVVVCIISTVLPGTMDKKILPLIKNVPGMKIVYNPFFIAMGTTIDDFLNPEFVLIGVHDKPAADLLQVFYKSVVNDPLFKIMDIRSAEATKVLYNTYITQKIVFANAVGELCEATGADANSVISAITSGNRRIISSMYMQPGMGDGGGCLTPGQEIITYKGIKNIEDVEIGDFVLTDKGRFKEVISIFERKYSGDIYYFYVAGHLSQPLILTKEHPVFVSKRICAGKREVVTINNNYDQYNRKPTRLAPPKKYDEIDLLKASEIETGDAIISRVNHNKYQFTLPPSVQTNKHYEPLMVKRADPEYMRLLGWYLAEGSTTFNASKYEVRFSLSADELEIGKWIKDMMLKWHGVSCQLITKNNNLSVRCYSKRFGKEVLQLFNSRSYNKIIPYSWLNLPDEYLKELLRGMFAGDGSVDINKFHFYTTSKELMYFTTLALKRFNINHGVSIRKARVDKNNVNHRISYIVRSTDKKILPLLNKPFQPGKNIRTRWYDEKGNFYSPVKKIVKEKYNGLVYNLEVADDNSYSVISGSVSNCHPRDNIALSHVAEKYNICDIWKPMMRAREEQTKNMAEHILETAYQHNMKFVILLGASFKPETNITTGSPALLLYYYLHELKGKYQQTSVSFYDPHVDPEIAYKIDLSKLMAVYFVSTNHDCFHDKKFAKGSVVIDPWGTMARQDGVAYIYPGRHL